MRLIVPIMLVVLRVTTASAQTQPQAAPSPEALAAAKDLMAVMSPDRQMMQAMFAQMWPQVERSLGTRIDAATSAELRAEFERTLQKYVVDSLQDMPAIYARYFTADELRELAGFYKTPIGAKQLSVMPKINAELSGTMLPRMNAFQQELQGRMQEILRKHGIQ
jgi:uncharacterized protein